MRTLSKGFSSSPVTALALALMLSAAPASAQTAQGAATDRTATSPSGATIWPASLSGASSSARQDSPRAARSYRWRRNIPAGVEFGWHVHPGEEVGYIIAGEVEMKVEGRPHRHPRAPATVSSPCYAPRTMRATLVRRRGGCCRPISSSKASRSRRSSGSMSRSSRHFPDSARGGFSVASCHAAAVRFYEDASQIIASNPSAFQ